MYPELQKYYSDCFVKNGFSENEKEEIVKATEIFYRINLLTVEEYRVIKDELSGTLGRKITTIPLNKRAQNALLNANIYSCRQLRELLINNSGEELLFWIRNLGNKNIKDVIEKSCEAGIATYDEIYNAKWTHYRKSIIEEVTKNKIDKTTQKEDKYSD